MTQTILRHRFKTKTGVGLYLPVNCLFTFWNLTYHYESIFVTRRNISLLSLVREISLFLYRLLYRLTHLLT